MKINGIEITGIADNSKNVKPGFAFFAVIAPYYINDAKKNGAAVVITENVRQQLAAAAREFFAPLPENIIAVTGTNGKTSVVNFCAHILKNMGLDAASIGTIGISYHGETNDFGNTTPGAIYLCQKLGELKSRGCDYVAIEASSHGLEQSRMAAVPVRVAGFTNITRDHLDYHGTMENYLNTKKKLFTEILAPDGVAVLNADDATFGELKGCGRKILSYGKDGDIKLTGAQYRGQGQAIDLKIAGEKYKLDIGASGEFQTYNIMCAIGMAIGLGFRPADAVRAAAGGPAPAGRMQFAGSPADSCAIYVDYAHTPDGIRNVLSSARKLCRGRLIVLFGAGGDRDAGKRPLMGLAAAELADVVYITDDNPRTEDAAKIRAQVLAAAPNAVEIADRAAAIARAVNDMRRNDILVIAGKWHEDYQIIGTAKHYFSDIEEVRKAIKKAGRQR